MKSSLFLLAAMVGGVCGTHLGAEIRGVTTIGDPCTQEQDLELYQVCVEDIFVSMGGVLDRRLELRGNRDLQTSNHCSGCDPGYSYPLGHWCYVMCSARRRLAVADEHVHTDRFLVSEEELQQAATECYVHKITNGYECLGNPEDLTIRILLSE
jgi:hypothetical protein